MTTMASGDSGRMDLALTPPMRRPPLQRRLGLRLSVDPTDPRGRGGPRSRQPPPNKGGPQDVAALRNVE